MSGENGSDPRKLTDRLYDAYSRYVYKLAWQHCTHPEDVEDLVQEVWVKICANPYPLDGLTKGQQLFYLSTAVRNTAISMSRNASENCPLDAVYGMGYNGAEILNRMLDRRVSVQQFRKLWPQVPQAARELLERKYFLEESDEEIARALGISARSVRMYLTRARRLALSTLEEHRESLESLLP